MKARKRLSLLLVFLITGFGFLNAPLALAGDLNFANIFSVFTQSENFGLIKGFIENNNVNPVKSSLKEFNGVNIPRLEPSPLRIYPPKPSPTPVPVPRPEPPENEPPAEVQPPISSNQNQPPIIKETIIRQVVSTPSGTTLALIQSLELKLNQALSSFDSRFQELRNTTPTIFQLPSTNTGGVKTTSLNPDSLTSNSLTVNGTGTLDDLTITRKITVGSSTITIDGTNNKLGIGDSTPETNFEVVGTASISGASTFGSTITITGKSTFTTGEFQGTASASYFLTGNTLQVGGFSSAAYSRFGTATATDSSVDTTNDLLISGSLEVDGTFRVDGTASHTLAGEWNFDSNTFVIDSGTNRVGIGTTDLTVPLEVVGAASISGATTLRGVTYTWPSADGANARFLQTNGSGTLSWAQSVTSNSLDFDEIVNSPTLDANLNIQRAGYYIGIGAAPQTVFEVQGTASASYLLTGNTLQVGGFASAAYSRFGTATATSSLLSTTNDLLISGNLEVDSETFFDSAASISGNFQTGGRFIFGDSGDTGEINTSDWDISNTGNLSGIGTINADGAYTQTGTGANTFSGATTFSSTGNALLVSAGRSEVQGTASASYLLTGNTLQVGGFSSAAYSRFGTATATDAAIGASNDLLISDSLEVDGTFRVDGTASHTLAGEWNFDSNTFVIDSGTNRVGIGTTDLTVPLEVVGAASISGTTTLRGVTYTWPSADGTADQRLTTNGSGTLSWATAGGVSSNSLDFDEFVNTMLLDSNLTINRGGYYIGLGAAPSTVFEVQGTASASYLLTGNTLQVGGYASVAYNRFGTTATTHSNYISTSNDILVSGDLEGRGSLSFAGVASLSNALWVSPGGYSGNVGIGTRSPGAQLELTGNILIANGNRVLFKGSNGTYNGDAYIQISSDNVVVAASTSLVFRTKAETTRMTIAKDGNVGIGTTVPGANLHVSGDVANNIAFFYNSGNATNRTGPYIRAGTFDASGTNTAIAFADGDGTSQGDILFTSGTVTYAAFTANHNASLPEEFNKKGYPYGTLVCIKNIYLKENQERGIEYNVEACDKKYAANVLGAYAGKRETEENLHLIYVLGDGHLLVNGEGGDVEIGDLITTSSTPGIGMKATEFGLTIGLAQENYTFSNPNETKLIAVQYGLRYKPMNAIASSSDILTADNGAIFDLDLASANSVQALFASLLNQFKQLGVFFENGIVRAKEFVAEKITAKQIKTEELCVDDICVTREQFKKVFGEGNQSLIIDNSPTPEPFSGITPEPIFEPTPEPTPEPVPTSSPSLEPTPGPTPTPAPSPEPVPEITPEPAPEESPAPEGSL